MVKKAIIVTPTSLVGNWEAEINKWVGERVQLIALCESTKDDVMTGINSFINPLSPLQVILLCCISKPTLHVLFSNYFSTEGILYVVKTTLGTDCFI